jgi:hypothetical protein
MISGVALCQNILGLLRMQDQADRDGGDVGLFSDFIRVRHLKAIAARNLRRRRRAQQSARGTVDQVDTARFCFTREGDLVGEFEAAFDTVDRRDTHR